MKTTKKHTGMNAQELRLEIENLANELNITFIEACQAMQAAAAKMKDEKTITAIHYIKMSSINNR